MWSDPTPPNTPNPHLNDVIFSASSIQTMNLTYAVVSDPGQCFTFLTRHVQVVLRFPTNRLEGDGTSQPVGPEGPHFIHSKFLPPNKCKMQILQDKKKGGIEGSRNLTHCKASGTSYPLCARNLSKQIRDVHPSNIWARQVLLNLCAVYTSHFNV